MKTIEEGCMAIIVKGAQNPKFPTNIGKIVTVGRFICSPHPMNKLRLNLWEVNKPIQYESGELHNFIPEGHMERIDYDGSEEDNHAEKITKKTGEKITH